VSGERSRGISSFILLVAAAAMAVGTFLAWPQLSSKGITFAGGSVGELATGLQVMYGWLTLGAGVLAAAVAIGVLATGRRGRFLGLLVVMVSLLAAAVVAFAAATGQDRFVDFAAETASSAAFPPHEVRAQMEQLLVQNAVDVRPGLGIIVSGAGSILAAGWGLAALILRPRGTKAAGRGESHQDEEPSAAVVEGRF
jgi:hypothetical protein